MSDKKENSKNLFLTKEERIGLSDDLKFFGYLLPTNDDELDEFEKIYGSTQTILPEKFNDLKFLSKDLIDEESAVKNLENDFFKKMVLAAEIVNQLYNEPTFGHIKFMKVLYLSEEVCKMQLSTCYGKYAAGPFDPKYLHTVDSFLEKRKWFKKEKREQYGIKYVPLENCEDYKSYYNNYYFNEQESINHLIILLRKQKTDFCEIVATLFYVWDECLNKNIQVNDTLLIENFYKWAESKKRFQKQVLLNSLQWMRDNRIVPVNK